MDPHFLLGINATYGEIDFALNSPASGLVILRRRLAEDISTRRMIHSRQLVIWRWQLERRIRRHNGFYQQEYRGSFAGLAKDFPQLQALTEEQAHFVIVAQAYYATLQYSQSIFHRVPTHLRPIPPFHGLVTG
jgi:hypothetical protein